MTTADTPTISPRSSELISTLSRRILVLDGAMGTMIQQKGLSEADFRRDGITQADSPHSYQGCNDLLCLTRPDVIKDIHKAYIEAGADIIETNSFNSNAISLADYNLGHLVTDLNLTAARIAREVADQADRNIWVAGSIGPTGKSLSMEMALNSPDAVSFDNLENAYFKQISALIEGGVDTLLIETIFDALNARAAAFAARRAMKSANREVPIIFSVTLTESGRTLSGQTLEAFITSVSHARPLAVGLNCGFGAEAMTPFLHRLNQLPFYVSVYPNAGLPNAMGQYDESPEKMATQIARFMDDGLVNIVGGCCGTTPAHISAIADEARRHEPRRVPQPATGHLRLAGLDNLDITPGAPLIKVGERCNVAGSRKFLRLIKDRNFAEALDIARAQLKAGAQIIDINMDDAMLEARTEMSQFLARLGAEPDLARVPVMIDSSSWPVIVEALKHVQGRPIVNSISLKGGEEEFLERARHISQIGAAMVVMAFDEKGQADTFERRIEICGRAYHLLTGSGKIAPEDIIFDPNVLTVATGIDEHRRYALDFIRATSWIKENLPGARVSGGLSNLSFAFRGNTPLREAMHAVFLELAVPAGLDMAIVNPAAMLDPNSISAELHEALTDVLLDRNDEATDRLVAIAAEMKAAAEAAKGNAKPKTAETPSSDISPIARLTEQVAVGDVQNIESLTLQALAEVGSPLGVIDGALMEAMNRVGERFGAGEIFLPQVVKSARAMKQAVAVLAPEIEKENARHNSSVQSAPPMVLATVKGDVHDIGKNIVGIVMQCNGFDVHDLGVMVEGNVIVDTAIATNAAFVGLSGLITPSLEEMRSVARLMESRGLSIPLLVGGAAASAEHTAVKIAPLYSGPVIYTRDAAVMPSVARRFSDPATHDAAIEELNKEQQHLREQHSASAPLLPLAKARSRKVLLDFSKKSPSPLHPGTHTIDIPVADVIASINVRAFLKAWGLDASLASIVDVEDSESARAAWLASLPDSSRAKGIEAFSLWKNAESIISALAADKTMTLTARIVLTEAYSEDDNIRIGEISIPTLRRQTDDGSNCVSLADFLDSSNDWLGLFAVTLGERLKTHISAIRDSDDYNALLAQSISDRLVEAATERMHYIVRTRLWGYNPDEPDEPRRLLRAEYPGIRPAIGFPSLPDQSVIFITDKLLHYHEIGITVTENGAMSPASSTTGLIFAHPDSKYFVLGHIADDQRDDYSKRRGLNTDISKFLPN